MKHHKRRDQYVKIHIAVIASDVLDVRQITYLKHGSLQSILTKRMHIRREIKDNFRSDVKDELHLCDVMKYCSLSETGNTT